MAAVESVHGLGRFRTPLMKISVCLLLALLPWPALIFAEAPRVRPAAWAQPVIGSTLENFYQVSPEFYRSEQPGESDLRDLQALGIRTVVSLRHYHADPAAFERAGIKLVLYPMDAGDVSAEKMIDVLRLIRASPKPVLVHCWHGSDRTGFIVAGYRLVFMRWPATEAVAELRWGGFGYHESWYPRIARLLGALEVDAIRQAVMAEAPPPPAAPSKP